MDVYGFTETALFTRRWHKLGLTDDDLASLQLRLMKNPEEGKVVPGGQGRRKIRLGLSGRGKRGGARVIYLVYRPKMNIELINIYTKNEKQP